MVGSQWERFKQSNVARIFIAYAVVAFGLMQVFDYLLPIIEAPLWVAQTLTLLLFLGFPISLLVGWVTQRPIVPSGSEPLSLEPGYAQNLSRQKLVLIGLGSSAVFGFLGLILMPYLLDQASFSSVDSRSNSYAGLSSYRSLRYQINLGETRARVFGSRSDIALSPNGSVLVYTVFRPPSMILMVKDMNSFDPDRELASLTMNGTNGYPQFSSDGQWIYYHQNGGIFRVRLEGGSPQTVVENGASPSGVAVSGQKVIYHNENSSSLEILDISTGQVVPIGGTVREKGVHNHTWPHILEDGKTILATRGTRGDYSNSSIDMINLENGEVTQIIPVGFKGVYANSGHIIFARGGSVWAQPFDKEMLKVRGDAVPIIFDTEIYEQYGNVGIALSDAGRLIFIDGVIQADSSGSEIPVFVDRDGNERELGIEPSNFSSPQLNPNEDQVAFQIATEGGADIWVYDLESQTLGRRTFDSLSARPIWSFDGRDLIYSCELTAICTVASNGTETETLLLEGFQDTRSNYQESSRDLLLTAGTQRKVYRLSTDTTAENSITDLELGPGESEYAKLSSDEKWIAYSSNETGQYEIYVRPYPNIANGKWQVSRRGGRFPMWNPDISELFWWNIVTKELFSANISVLNNELDSTEIRFSNPELLFEADSSYRTNGWPPIDYASKTDEFILIKDGSTNADDVLRSQTHLSVIENWFEELAFSAPSDPNM